MFSTKQAMNEVLVGFANEFMAALTSRQNPITAGENQDCAPIISAFQDFLSEKNMLDVPCNHDWQRLSERFSEHMDEWLQGQKDQQIAPYAITDFQALVLTAISKTIYSSCLDAGWYTDLDTGKPKDMNIGERIALMHSELSEALEGWRKDKMDDHLPDRKSLEVEFADTVIRIFDTAAWLELDIGKALQEKFAYNQQRADHKMENRQLAGGKKI